jgi:2-methylisocitrate lyase-like PEP mutase family enzyme
LDGRISLGSTLWRAASGALLRAAREMKELGTFAFTADAMPFAAANAVMLPTPRP